MRTGAVRGVVFDLDGTLVDSMPRVLEAFAHAVLPFRSPLSAEEWRARMGGPPRRILEDVLADEAQVSEALLRLQKTTAELWARIPAFAGMKAIIAELSDGAVAVGVWTGRDRCSAEIVLDAHSVREKLIAYVCGDDLPTHKPDPAGLSAVLRQMSVDPTEAILVGDSEVDVSAGADLGVKTILITHGLIMDTAIQARAWRVVKRPVDAYDLLRSEVFRQI